MPGSSESTTGGSQIMRRSSRIRSRQGIKDDISIRQVTNGKRRRLENSNNPRLMGTLSECISSGSTELLAGPFAGSIPPSRRRSQRITPTELIKRETKLLAMEDEYKRKFDELDVRVQSLSRKENEAQLRLSQMAERDAKATLTQLEEHFTCPLCCEIMGSPYTLNPAKCGHTFCGICILKWFFSRLHRICGGWHESVDCPLCRSLLVITPERTPRSSITFPFIPNRTATAILESLIEQLYQISIDSLEVKKEDDQLVAGSQSKSEKETQCNGKRSRSQEDEDLETDNSAAAEWREGGALRAEWLKRSREGKQEMDHLLRFWATMGSAEFIAMKDRLGVGH